MCRPLSEAKDYVPGDVAVDEGAVCEVLCGVGFVRGGTAVKGRRGR